MFIPHQRTGSTAPAEDIQEPARRNARYGDLLQVAEALGRVDGALATAFESADPFRAASTCRGRTPSDFALLLWGDRPGAPPAGLIVNGPLWYDAGFQRALMAGLRSPRDTGAGAN